MMRSKFKAMFVALLAVTALGAVASASASAAAKAPIFAKSSGGYPVKFSAGEEPEGVWNTGNATFHCSRSRVTGEITSEKKVTATIVFTECASGGSTCANEGGTGGEIKSNALEGTLVFISKATKTVGVVFKSKPGGARVSRFRCAGSIGEVQGSVIAAITPVNTKTKHFTLTFVQESGKQTPTEYENEEGVKVKTALETTWASPSGGWHSLGWELNPQITTEQELE